MAQFRATIQGNRGEASRLGSKASGLEGHICGWDCGVRVVAQHVDGHDQFDVYLTGGSNGTRQTEFVATVFNGNHHNFISEA